jgi:hypothetical protein
MRKAKIWKYRDKWKVAILYSDGGASFLEFRSFEWAVKCVCGAM